jgi:hypothetical protein
MRDCQLGPERSVHKNVDNLTPFRVGSETLFLGLDRAPGHEIRNFTSWKGAENAHRTRFCHIEHARTISGTRFRYLIRRITTNVRLKDAYGYSSTV